MQNNVKFLNFFPLCGEFKFLRMGNLPATEAQWKHTPLHSTNKRKNTRWCGWLPLFCTNKVHNEILGSNKSTQWSLVQFFSFELHQCVKKWAELLKKEIFAHPTSSFVQGNFVRQSEVKREPPKLLCLEASVDLSPINQKVTPLDLELMFFVDDDCWRFIFPAQCWSWSEDTREEINDITSGSGHKITGLVKRWPQWEIVCVLTVTMVASKVDGKLQKWWQHQWKRQWNSCWHGCKWIFGALHNPVHCNDGQHECNCFLVSSQCLEGWVLPMHRWKDCHCANCNSLPVSANTSLCVATGTTQIFSIHLLLQWTMLQKCLHLKVGHPTIVVVLTTDKLTNWTYVSLQ